MKINEDERAILRLAAFIALLIAITTLSHYL